MATETPQAATPAERRRLQQREDVRRAILDATEELLVEDGWDRFSMRRLAERCGYTAPTIYHHFGDKQGLIDELLEQRFGLLLGRLRRVPRRPEPLDTLRAYAATFARFALKYQTHYRLLTAPRPDDAEPPPAALQAQELFEEPIRELEQARRLRARDMEEAKQCLWAVMHGVVSLKTSLPDHEWSKDLVERSIDFLLRGLVDPPESGR